MKTPYLLDQHNLLSAFIGDEVWVCCLNSARGVRGVVTDTGASSTPGCWRVAVTPHCPRHPVRPIVRACRLPDDERRMVRMRLEK